jgi:hypothetical protein
MVQILSTQSDHEMTANHTAAISVLAAAQASLLRVDTIPSRVSSAGFVAL